MSVRERKVERKSGKERKRAQTSAKERFYVKIANNQVWHNQIGELPSSGSPQRTTNPP